MPLQLIGHTEHNDSRMLTQLLDTFIKRVSAQNLSLSYHGTALSRRCFIVTALFAI